MTDAGRWFEPNTCHYQRKRPAGCGNAARRAVSSCPVVPGWSAPRPRPSRARAGATGSTCSPNTRTAIQPPSGSSVGPSAGLGLLRPGRPGSCPHAFRLFRGERCVLLAQVALENLAAGVLRQRAGDDELSALVIEDVADTGEVICAHPRTRDGGGSLPRVRRANGPRARVPGADGGGRAWQRRLLVTVRVRRIRCPATGPAADVPRASPRGVLDRYQRRTTRLTAQVSAVAGESAGRAMVPVLLKIPLPALAVPRVLGITARCPAAWSAPGRTADVAVQWLPPALAACLRPLSSRTAGHHPASPRPGRAARAGQQDRGPAPRYRRHRDQEQAPDPQPGTR